MTLPRAPSRTLPRRLRFLLFTLIINVTLFGAAEVVARLLSQPYYEKVAREDRLDRDKKPGEKRVFVYGGSTIYGHPYGPGNSTARWLQTILKDVLPDQSIQVVNFGRPGRGSAHLRDALEHTLDYQPDAVVLCTGHNEFLPANLGLVQGTAHRWCYFHSALYRSGYDGLYRWRSKKDDGQGQYAGIAPWQPLHSQVLDQYQINVEAMVQLARDQEVAVVLCVPACNLRDMPPQQSQHVEPLEPAAARAFETCLKQLRDAHRQRRLDLAALDQVTAMRGRHAEAIYRHAQALQLQGRTEEADQAYAEARDLDYLPFRCQSRQIAMLRELSAKHRVPLVDLPAVFRDGSGGRAPGLDLFIDACHPRPRGQYLMALTMAQGLQAQGHLAPATGWHWERLPSFEACVQQLGLTPDQWRAPELAALFIQLDVMPELAAEITRVLPARASGPDREWQALHLLATWRCGRQTEARQLWSALPDSDRQATLDLTQNWPVQVRRFWEEMCRQME